MAYQFSNEQAANAYIVKSATDKYKIAGVNGQQTNANNFQTSIMGLLHVVGKDNEVMSTGRTISQDVEELP